MRTTTFTGALAALCGLCASALTALPAQAAPREPTIVLVHGAFADDTSWHGVAAELRADGRHVVTPANPLRGPASDAAAIERFLADIDGPIVLVGHSYGGAVISNVSDPDVTALVYIAAFAPQHNEPTQLALDPIRYPGSRLLPPALAVASTGAGVDAYVDPRYFREVFAQDVSEQTAADMIAHQRSLALTANLEPSGPPAWASVPSWYLVAGQDRVIPPASQRAMAARMGARTSEVTASHACLVSQPAAVADVIAEAADQ
ncbi:alpha/beta fold hydrolase [Nocardia cyriacigeorgica]|uniref:alpha/beta fold hydrolase n=1 Tax=Nocardia cyriacigeorgica TaxID=135487 RepID=UPI0013D61345|nr:alpha/beta hydrolase [Nocardia cyriacigeorgica]NEW28753.1 alpha/beta hydrolase [Nocardia cyriacigeorgica]